MAHCTAQSSEHVISKSHFRSRGEEESTIMLSHLLADRSIAELEPVLNQPTCKERITPAS